MPGANRQRLSPGAIRQCLQNPIGTKTISSLATKKEEAVIIFHDMTRPTRAFEIIPFILDELAKGRISDDHIRFVDALGCHGADDRLDFVKKLGEWVKKWTEVLEEINTSDEKHPRVAVYPNAEIQCPPQTS